MERIGPGAWSGVAMTGGRLLDLRGTNTFSKCAFRGAEIRGIKKGALATFDGCTFENCRFDAIEDGAARFRGCSFDGAAANAPPPRKADGR